MSLPLSVQRAVTKRILALCCPTIGFPLAVSSVPILNWRAFEALSVLTGKILPPAFESVDLALVVEPG